MYKLLLVDDEQIIREGLARMIDWEGLGNNPHYFSQLFRKYTGLTPTEYRSRLENERS